MLVLFRAATVLRTHAPPDVQHECRGPRGRGTIPAAVGLPGGRRSELRRSLRGAAREPGRVPFPGQGHPCSRQFRLDDLAFVYYVALIKISLWDTEVSIAAAFKPCSGYRAGGRYQCQRSACGFSRFISGATLSCLNPLKMDGGPGRRGSRRRTRFRRRVDKYASMSAASKSTHQLPEQSIATFSLRRCSASMRPMDVLQTI